MDRSGQAAFEAECQHLCLLRLAVESRDRPRAAEAFQGSQPDNLAARKGKRRQAKLEKQHG